MKNNVPELDKLFSEVGTYRKGCDFKKLLEFIKKFPEIAPYNAMLIHIQKPGSAYVATANEWKRRFNREVKLGANPLVILRQFGPVEFVFELGDTEGDDPFPEELINPFKVDGEISDRAFERLVNNLRCDAISYVEANLGTTRAGSIQISNPKRNEKITRKRIEILVNIMFDMTVNKNHPKETKFATILHELGHLYCGHLGTPNPKWWSDRRSHDKIRKEFEAESVCWLVCERMGIKNPSAEYLSGYLDNNSEIPLISIDSVLKSVGLIESMIKGIKEPRKEIVITKNKIC